MALKGKWVDKVNGVDMNNADDINQVAHAVMELEEKESGGISQETDPTVPSWAKQANKPKYTASEVGADARGTAVSAVSAHNVDDESHQDIRILLSELKSAVNAFLDIDDETYDQLSELIQKIEENADSIEKITNGKVNVADIVNNLTSNVTNKPLSAAQGVALKALIDAITVPTKLSALAGDATHRTVTDAEKTAWNAKLGQSDLQAATNAALAQAKESGEFDGEDGRGIKSIARTSGTGAAGTTDTYTITYTDNTTSTFTVYNGKNGTNGKDYVLTELDKEEIAALAAIKIKEGGVIGVIDKNNNVILSGNLADGDYTVKYEMEDGSTVGIGNLVLDTNVYYSVTNNLTNCTNNNNITEVTEGESYSATISANSGYELKSVVVTMGGSPVSVSGGNISIASVTGNIVITAVAEEIQTGPTNLADPSSNDWLTDNRLSTSSGGGSSCTGHILTNYIPAKMGDVVRVKGLDITVYVNGKYGQVACYKSDKTYQHYATTGIGGTASVDAAKNSVTVNGDILTYTIAVLDSGAQRASAETAFIRLDGALMDGYTKEDVIITINEEIV